VNDFAATTRAEFLKMFSTRMWWLLLLILAVYVGLVAGGLSFGLGALQSSGSAPPPRPGTAPGATIGGIPTEAFAPVLYSLATAVGYVFPILLGSLAVTNEFRHKTLTPTFLATPRRGLVLGGKWVVLLLLGALFGVAALLATVGLGAAGLAVFGLDTGLGESGTWAMLARAVLAMALWAVVGVGIGVLVPSQVGSIVVVLAFTQFVEPILRLAAGFAEWAGEVGRFLPGAAGDALVGASIYTVMGGTAGATLDWWQGGLVLLGYAVLFTVLGYLTSWRRDVT
jgi:ABC-2 type transport system permease protein